jgi:hypothetical protein
MSVSHRLSNNTSDIKTFDLKPEKFPEYNTPKYSQQPTANYCTHKEDKV